MSSRPPIGSSTWDPKAAMAVDKLSRKGRRKKSPNAKAATRENICARCWKARRCPPPHSLFARARCPCHHDFRLFAAASPRLHFACMARLTRWFLILLALAFSARLAFAADVRESSAFDTAVQTFKISRELSVQDFADFIRKYPTSVRRPEAILYEAQGMLYGGDATNAIQLLSTNHSDKLAPKYLYWLGQAYF